MIFCFSACGNTELVASRLATLLGEKIQRVDINAPESYNVGEHQRIIWATPIYSWGLPKEMLAFISKVTLIAGEKAEHFLVATCGDDAGLADKMWRKAIRRKGWMARAAHTVIMPNTYVALPGFDVDSPSLAQEKLSRAVERTKEVARAIKCSSGIDTITRGRFAWIKTRIVYPLFMRFLTSPRPFGNNDRCTGCTLCSRVCPMGNISVISGTPKWGNRCTMCLACYHHCPHKAIGYGTLTSSKGQYVAPGELPQAKNQ